MSESESNDSSDFETKGGIIAIRGQVMVLRNHVLLIQNISSISVTNLSYEKRIPIWAWWLLAINVVATLILSQFHDKLSALTLVSTIIVVIAMYIYYSKRKVASFALRIIMNAGNKFFVWSADAGFLKAIAKTLCSVISEKTQRSLTFNVDNRQVFDNVQNSVIALGNVSGDIVNSV
jgi:hypothetical protein